MIAFSPEIDPLSVELWRFEVFCFCSKKLKWLAGWLVGWLGGWLAGRLAGRLAGWLAAGWLAGWLAELKSDSHSRKFLKVGVWKPTFRNFRPRE